MSDRVYGKIGKAPCGHSGEAIIGQYYRCLIGCDEESDNWDDITLEIPKCPACGSVNVDEDFQVDPIFYIFNPNHPIVDTRCIDCGKVWTK